MDFNNKTITITFGDQAENHVGMQKIGQKAESGFTIDDIKNAKINFEKAGCVCELHMLNDNKKLKKYNTDVKSIFQLKEVRDKAKKTILEKYGVENASQSNICKDKRAISMEKMFAEKGIKMKRYNYESLITFCKDNKIILLKDYKNEIINSNYTIESKCTICNNGICKKTVRNFFENPYCPNCTANKRLKTLEENNLAKYGVKNVFEIKAVKDKLKQTNLKKYGVENPSQSEEFKNKKENTFIKNYGVTCGLKSTEIKEKIKQTNLNKYGVRNVSQNKEISEKQQNAYKLKEYKLPSGKILKYQGYENYGLDMLIYDEKVNENDIETGRTLVPELWYTYENDKHRHFVDIYVKSQKRCIEIKSTWTFKKHKNKVFAKQEQAKKDGYIYEIYIYNEKGKLIEQYK